MAGTGSSLISAFDYVWQRFTARIDGLGDDEYFWEPGPDAGSCARARTAASASTAAAAGRRPNRYR